MGLRSCIYIMCIFSESACSPKVSDESKVTAMVYNFSSDSKQNMTAIEHSFDFFPVECHIHDRPYFGIPAWSNTAAILWYAVYISVSQSQKSCLFRPQRLQVYIVWGILSDT